LRPGSYANCRARLPLDSGTSPPPTSRHLIRRVFFGPCPDPFVRFRILFAETISAASFKVFLSPSFFGFCTKVVVENCSAVPCSGSTFGYRRPSSLDSGGCPVFRDIPLLTCFNRLARVPSKSAFISVCASARFCFGFTNRFRYIAITRALQNLGRGAALNTLGSSSWRE